MPDKRETNTELTLRRVGTSPYFDTHFIQQEKKCLEELEGVSVLPLSIENSKADIIITNTHIPMNKEALTLFDKTKLIIHSNSGYDNFSLDFVKQFQGPIILGNEIRKAAVASYILSSFFHFFSTIPTEKEWSKERKWDRVDIGNLNVQLIGFGHIGRDIDQSLRPYVNKVNIYDPFKNYNQLDISTSDVIILCCGLNPTSKHILNKDLLKQCSRDLLIINAARGELIHTIDLIDYLKHHPNSFAFLDVFESEPMDFNFFHPLKNVQLTSHIAGVFRSIHHKTILFERQVVFDFQQLSIEHFEKKYFNLNLKNKIHQDYLI